MKRKAFNFYASYWEQLKLMNKKQRVEVFDAVCKVQFLEENIDDIQFKDAMCQIVWTGMKHSIETSLMGFVNKSKGIGSEVDLPLSKGLSKGLSKEGAQQEQVQVQEEEQVQEKEKEQLTPPSYNEFESYALSQGVDFDSEKLRLKYNAWIVNDWIDGRGNPIKNWKSKLSHTLPYLKNDSARKSKSGGFDSPASKEAFIGGVRLLRGESDIQETDDSLDGIF